LLRLANLLITAVIAHILSPHDFGVFAVALTVYTIISSIADAGVSSCLFRADLDIDSLAPTIATIAVVSSAVLAGAMIAFARPIAVALGSAEAVGPIRVMAISVVFTGVFAVPNAQLVRDFKQDKIFLANAVSFVPSTALLIVLAEARGGAMAFAWSRVVGQFVLGSIQIAAASRHYRPGLSRSALSVALRFGIPLAGANFVNLTLLNVDYAFVGHLLGAALLGVYMLAFTLASAPYSILGAVINNVAMPAFSRVKHDRALLKNAISAALHTISLIVMPMCGLTMVLARPLVLTLYGARWEAAANVLAVLSLYGSVFMVCLLFANVLTSFGRTKLLLFLQLIWIGTLVPAMALGVHKDGIVGAAYAHVTVIAPIVLPSYLLALKRVTGVRFAALGRAIIPALLASSAAALAARGAASQLSSPLAQLVAGLAAGGLVYLVCLGRQVAALLGRGQAAERVLRFYSSAARLTRLSARGRAKHSARHADGRAAETPKDAGPGPGSILGDAGRQPAAGPRANPASYATLTNGNHQGGWLTQAVAFLERALADRERTLGPDHPHTLASRADLAYAYGQAGWMAKAIPLCERTYGDWSRLLGPDHPRTLRSSNYLASAYLGAGRLAEAIPLYERTLAGRERLLGPDHPSTLRSSSYLASAYREAGRLAEAIPLYERTRAGWRLLLGPDHARTLLSSSYLASAYREAGLLREATLLYAETLARCTRVLGSDHALTRDMRRNLSVTQELTASQSRRPDPSTERKQERHRRDAEAAKSRW
jgi:lipopolysaccharide exporter